VPNLHISGAMIKQDLISVLINYTDVIILVRPSKYAYENCPS